MADYYSDYSFGVPDYKIQQVANGFVIICGSCTYIAATMSQVTKLLLKLDKESKKR